MLYFLLILKEKLVVIRFILFDLYLILYLNYEFFCLGFLHEQFNSSFQEGKIIKMNCNVKFYKIIPLDLETTPYVILVCKGIHSHPLPLPLQVPLEIINKLKSLIESTFDQFIDITAKKLISSKYFVLII